MAVASKKLISVLRSTAHRLQNSTNYQWGHMGACNCGHLAQEITHLSKAEIHEIALEGHGIEAPKSGNIARRAACQCIG